MLLGELPWAVQWLRLHSFNAGSRASISGWGIKIPHITIKSSHATIIKKKKKDNIHCSAVCTNENLHVI